MTPAVMSDYAPAPTVPKPLDQRELAATIAACAHHLQLAVHVGSMTRAAEQIDRLRVLCGLWPGEVNG